MFRYFTLHHKFPHVCFFLGGGGFLNATRFVAVFKMRICNKLLYQ